MDILCPKHVVAAVLVVRSLYVLQAHEEWLARQQAVVVGLLVACLEEVRILDAALEAGNMFISYILYSV
jgi:hypothetical protein